MLVLRAAPSWLGRALISWLIRLLPTEKPPVQTLSWGSKAAPGLSHHQRRLGCLTRHHDHPAPTAARPVQQQQQEQGRGTLQVMKWQQLQAPRQ